MSLRRLRISGSIAIAILAVAGSAAAQCTLKAPVDVILVDFPGCARINIGGAVDVIIDGVPIPVTVTKDAKSNYYRGTLPAPRRQIGELHIRSTEAGGCRTGCNVKAAPFSLAIGGAACAAVFHVPCAPFWHVKIDSDPDPKQPTPFEFWRELQTKDAPCGDEETATKPLRRRTPVTIPNLSSSEMLVVKIADSDGKPAEFPVTRSLLERGGSIHLVDLEPRSTTESFPSSAMHELKRAEARRFADLLLQLATGANP